MFDEYCIILGMRGLFKFDLVEQNKVCSTRSRAAYNMMVVLHLNDEAHSLKEVSRTSKFDNEAH